MTEELGYTYVRMGDIRVEDVGNKGKLVAQVEGKTWEPFNRLFEKEGKLPLVELAKKGWGHEEHFRYGPGVSLGEGGKVIEDPRKVTLWRPKEKKGSNV